MTDVCDVPVNPPGSARAPGPTLREQLLADPTRPPWPPLEQSPVFLGDDDVPFANYTSPEHAQAEFDLMWCETWQWACHVDHIPESGDYFVYDVGPHSALIVRTADGSIKADFNARMHRGTQLRAPGTCGFATQLRCPFHGWTWSLDGELIDLPDRWNFPHVSDESHRLPQLLVDVFAGFVWVNFDQQAAPLLNYLGVLPAHFAEFDIEDRYIETHTFVSACRATGGPRRKRSSRRDTCAKRMPAGNWAMRSPRNTTCLPRTSAALCTRQGSTVRNVRCHAPNSRSWLT